MLEVEAWVLSPLELVKLEDQAAVESEKYIGVAAKKGEWKDQGKIFLIGFGLWGAHLRSQKHARSRRVMVMRTLAS